jgi:hypothetical protein
VPDSLGSVSLAGAALAGTFLRARPYVTALTPSGSIEDETPTVTWSYSSTVPRAQEHYHVQLRNQNGTVVLWDSLVQDGADTSLAIDYRLSGGSSYRAYVRASDGFDWSLDSVTDDDWSYVLFTAETDSAVDFEDNDKVGSVYEIGINGVGYMLADSPEQPVERRSSTLQPPRFTTGDTPFSEAIERYTFLGYSDFKGGAGQFLRSRAESDPSRFWDSHGINPFEDEGLQLLHSTSVSRAGAYASARMIVSGGTAYLVTDVGDLDAQDEPGGAVTSFTIAAAAAPTSLASDGNYWYYADGAAIFRGRLPSDPGAAWSAIDADLIEWVGDRLAAVYDLASEWCVTTLAPDGTEEVVGGRFQYPADAGTSISAITSGDGFMWFALNKADRNSVVHYWQLGSADTYAAIGLELPAGQAVMAMGFYLGNLFIKATEIKPDFSYRNYIYRCIPDQGRLNAELVVQYDTTDADTPSYGAFVGIGRLVLFPWFEMTTEDVPKSGLGAIDLSTGGYSKWLTTSSTAVIRDVGNWGGRAVFLQDGDLVAEDDTYVASGWLWTSQDDLASTLQKVLDQVSVLTDPLPTNSSVSVSRSIDSGNSYSSVGSALELSGSSTKTWLVSTIARTIGLELTLTSSDGLFTPKLQAAQARVHPLPISDQLLVLPINCADQLSGLNGAPLPVNAPGAGLKRSKVLESLIGTQVRLQDIDWALTRTASIWEVVDVATTTRGVFDKHQNRRVDTAVTTLTLRRAV